MFRPQGNGASGEQPQQEETQDVVEETEGMAALLLEEIPQARTARK